MELSKREESYKKIFEKDRSTLIVFGGVGVGKTYLVKNCTPCKVDFFIDEPTYSMQVTSGNMRLAPPEVYGEARYHYDLECLMRKKIVVFDDLGCTPATDAYIKTMLLWINKRMEKGLKTIITTNLTPKELEDSFEKRIASRLLQNSISIILEGEDLRKTNRKTIKI